MHIIMHNSPTQNGNRLKFWIYDSYTDIYLLMSQKYNVKIRGQTFKILRNFASICSKYMPTFLPEKNDTDMLIDVLLLAYRYFGVYMVCELHLKVNFILKSDSQQVCTVCTRKLEMRRESMVCSLVFHQTEPPNKLDRKIHPFAVFTFANTPRFLGNIKLDIIQVTNTNLKSVPIRVLFNARKCTPERC